MVVCKNCAGETPDNAPYCQDCGARIAPYTEEETKAYISSLEAEAGASRTDTIQPVEATTDAETSESVGRERATNRRKGTSAVYWAIGGVFALVGIMILGGGTGPGSLFHSLGVVLLLVALYLLPSIIGTIRRKRNAMAIFVLNLLLGWTVVAWVVALVWAVTVDSDNP